MTTALNKQWQSILPVLLVGIFIGAAAYLGYRHGRKLEHARYDHDFALHNARLDSLKHIEIKLLDSIEVLALRRKVLRRVITDYQIRYDTIHRQSDEGRILSGLNTIINTPIPSHE